MDKKNITPAEIRDMVDKLSDVSLNHCWELGQYKMSTEEREDRDTLLAAERMLEYIADMLEEKNNEN